ncbi:MAG: UDP-N-acetylmuramoyl-L-alanyl-D-glutamate--2,6-diaminopimelate ligase [Alphaproteobacteria bacterium]|nr:UDP-N-acetylmuramoyl-L-alanyl-D-glutamate--2,6-diaminopimelate ligase [Alphaproteobacteria bacterium]
MGPHSRGSVLEKQVGQNKVEQIGVFSGLACDSRAVKPGYLFAALPGTRADGRAFIADAVRRGAVAVLGLPEARVEAEALGVRFIADENPRARLAHFAAAFFGVQPATIAAVTGTNGKTSVAVFLRQIWAQLGYKAASMGTIGVVAPSGTRALAHTTPDPIEIHRLLAELAGEDVDHLALEASSHGLDQHRLDGVRLGAAAFTNITRDHLDYHADFAAYLAAKLRLFSELMEKGSVAVINADAEHAADFVAAARGLRVLTVGERGTALKLVFRAPKGDGQELTVLCGGTTYNVMLPLAGGFQASNALVAAGLAIGLGDPAVKVFAALAHLKGAAGRLEKVAAATSGAPVYVDYAHTPDALETVLTALRPHAAGRLHVVFGCGGDRDRGKRQLMGAIAAKLADVAIVTDDNPRSEEPAAIRAEILAGCPDACEIGDRAEAIRAAVAALRAGDLLVIAGKGHESGQIVGTETRPFSDRDEAVKAALALGGKAAA